MPTSTSLLGKITMTRLFMQNDHLPVGVRPIDCKLLELLKIRFATPIGGIARINVNRDQFAVQLHTQDHLAFVGAPQLAQTW